MIIELESIIQSNDQLNHIPNAWSGEYGSIVIPKYNSRHFAVQNDYIIRVLVGPKYLSVSVTQHHIENFFIGRAHAFTSHTADSGDGLLNVIDYETLS